MKLALAISLLVALPYWPGAPDTPTDNRPVYADRIPVIDTLGVQDRRAFVEWNHCGSVRMFVSGRPAFSPGTITIIRGEVGDWPRGGWVKKGQYGVVFLPPGEWERSVPVIRHELGHALGFGHTNRRSVMGGSNHVQPVDCRGLRHYYGRT